MGPIFKGAAVVCLVALSGLQPAAGDLQYQVQVADKDAYTSVNLARVGQMSVRIGVLTENSDLAEGLKTTSPPTKKTKFVAQLPESEDQKYRQAVQNALQAGLDVLTSYPENDVWTTFWEDPAGANLARLLWSKSTKVGCGVGTCTGGEEARTPEQTVTFLVCQMEPAAEANTAPFDKEYYEALKERKTSLTEMTDEDLKAPVQGGAAAAVPSLLVAGLTAIVAFASA
ncbi:SAG family member [Eimeria mitis]|uniref:SAG family member n=1 Tax=Eimeria mitis TaxID=44415 RepID=U6K3P3_9EIME|nr:SAG family member [Eimeria mitis]CDJ32330.1 SAG family member [Eimeria mitis]